MAKKKAIISETGEFPASYNVLQEGDDGIWLKVFGPDPDLEDVYKGKSCIYVFSVNNDSIEISANNNRCVMMHCGSSATMLHQYIKE